MKKNSKRNVDPEKWQNELDFPNSPEPIKEPDSQETLESNITPEFAADVEMLDPLEYVDEPIVEAVNNLICDPTRAKLRKGATSEIHLKSLVYEYVVIRFRFQAKWKKNEEVSKITSQRHQSRKL
ncbi:hypothetical protein OUZ56_026317 [Daphnia magna]|uniref:Uncharacterized protein n=1 Tax=Daphnia magna TaxID=35525 RepID=A0ABQ9ZM60_9CRUS|nr:hypothetical protein OUZ56_026317 [Daphnia magna]